ncbi:hypothetical protein PDTK01_30830 [Phycicoccus sp. DTK01]|nr:hypothetical protein PDTK01_30830 [Phycicoccus sp. DTK01]
MFTEMLQPSHHVTIRLISFRPGPVQGDLKRAIEPFKRLSIYAERASQYEMIALDISPTDPVEDVIRVLRAGVADGSWKFEEGRITQAWFDATA